MNSCQFIGRPTARVTEGLPRGSGKVGIVLRGWFRSGAQLKEQVLERLGCGMEEHHGGGEKQKTAEQNAERLVQEELRQGRWTEQDVGKRRKTDGAKVKLAVRLSAETVMTLDWIAQRLQMGCRHTVAHCLKG
jgi:hypothetical protein